MVIKLAFRSMHPLFQSVESLLHTIKTFFHNIHNLRCYVRHDLGNDPRYNWRYYFFNIVSGDELRCVHAGSVAQVP